MLDNRNTAEAPLDAEDWQIVFEPYAQLTAQSPCDRQA
jgi:hypothetical protein